MEHIVALIAAVVIGVCPGRAELGAGVAAGQRELFTTSRERTVDAAPAAAADGIATLVAPEDAGDDVDLPDSGIVGC